MNNSQAERNVRWLLGPALVLTALSGCVSAADWHQRVDPELLGQYGKSAKVAVVIEFEGAPVPAPTMPVSVEARRAYVAALKARAQTSQQDVLRTLARLGLTPQTFWISNSVAVDLPLARLQSIARQAKVRHVHLDRKLSILPAPEESAKAVAGSCNAAGAPTWGVTRVQAPQVWALGFSGQGVTVAGADTGYDWTHPALRDKYRGWNGTTADHNYHWWDGIRTGGNATCAAASAAPCDDNGHGTHTMGTMVGDAGGGSVIGVAPQAKWIACRNMNAGAGTLSTYNNCFQFFLEPTRLDGTAGDTGLAPDVINNSWGCPTTEGCNTANFAQMESVINTLDAAGVLVVGSAGNDGSGCSTVNTPLAIFARVLTVGSSNSGDSMSSFSSRGPVSVDSSNRMKPEISAPGASICSSVPNNDYSTFSGTSMAGPHVAGVAALLISAYPAARGNPTLLKEAIIGTADPVAGITQTCGGIPAGTVPNNVGGFGRIDALQALQYLQALPAPPLFGSSFE
ncbi:MAG: S8 family serine peptidase [Ahniella sp.]|nr:S8 family serine peptidase [Ahniella sp.]